MDNSFKTILLQKSEKILKDNIYKKGNYPWGKYRMISPSKGGFCGIWNWDSAFHAIGMIPFDIEIAKENILGFIQFQLEDGMFPDVIYETGKIVDTFSKPPVMAYAAQKVYEVCNDIEFAKTVYFALVKNENFWTNRRKQGELFHYDADESVFNDTDKYRRCVGNESGWDNSPRWDNEPQNLWAIDLNCYMYLTYRSLAFFADKLNENSNIWDKRAEFLKNEIEMRLWNSNLRSYTDRNYITGKFSNMLTPASFMPLFTEIASKEHAECMNNIAKESFLPGMPTVSYTDECYSTLDKAYWRGPTWLNVAYFAAKGLKNYGFIDTAETVRDTVLRWVYDSGEHIYENYNSKTGKGLCQNHFSWSCVFVREFILNF